MCSPINLCNSLGSGLSDLHYCVGCGRGPWLQSVINFPFLPVHCLGPLLSSHSGIWTSGTTERSFQMWLSLTLYWIQIALTRATGVVIRREQKLRHTKIRWPCEDGGRDWNKKTNSLELEDTPSRTHQKLQKYNGGIVSKVFQRREPKGLPFPVSGFSTQSFCGWINYSCSWATKPVVTSLQP